MCPLITPSCLQRFCDDHLSRKPLTHPLSVPPMLQNCLPRDKGPPVQFYEQSLFANRRERESHLGDASFSILDRKWVPPCFPSFCLYLSNIFFFF